MTTPNAAPMKTDDVGRIEAYEGLKQHFDALKDDLQQHIDATQEMFQGWAAAEQQRAGVMDAVIDRLGQLELAQQMMNTNFAILGTDMVKRLTALEGGEVVPDDLHEAQQRGANFAQNVEEQIDAQMTQLFEEGQ